MPLLRREHQPSYRRWVPAGIIRRMATDQTSPAGEPSGSGFEAAFAAVRELVETFHSNKSYYLSADYQEAEVRRDFIDKLFVALGWDVNHETQRNPYEQEVKVERSVSAGGQRRADYAFHLAPNFRDVRFFVEAKKPYGDIATAENYFQTIRYGWNSGTPLSVLTDFEQFHVIDCRYKPDLETAIASRGGQVPLHRLRRPREVRRDLLALFPRSCCRRVAGETRRRAAQAPRQGPPTWFSSRRVQDRWTNRSSKNWTSIARSWPALSRIPTPIWTARR